MLRILLAIHTPDPSEVAFYAEEKELAPRVLMTGKISSFPDGSLKKVQVRFEVKSLQFAEDQQEINVVGTILLNLPLYPQFLYGDTLRIRGKLTLPPEWEDFSYRRYLEKEGIYAYIPWAEAELIEKNTKITFFSTLFHLRAKAETLLRLHIPEPEASFAVGILFGGDKGFPTDIVEEFRITGLSHLLALSGFNITILILFVFWMFQFLPRKTNLFLTLSFVCAFVLLTGASASVVRAAVMGSLALFILHFGYYGTPLYVLLWSIVLIVSFNPFLLYSDISFQLSVAAVIGLILFTPLWQKVFVSIPTAFGFRDALQTTLAAQIMALPLVALYFGRISLVSPVANLLVAPLVPLAMFFSFFTFFPGFHFFSGFLAYGILHFALFITHVFSQIPFADTPLSTEGIGLGIWYGILGIAWYYFSQKKEK